VPLEYDSVLIGVSVFIFMGIEEEHGKHVRKLRAKIGLAWQIEIENLIFLFRVIRNYFRNFLLRVF
jgi:hypothetical protein